jgi:hypothetical protein
MNPKNDLTQLIERLEAFEERCEIRLEALFAFIDPEERFSSNFMLTIKGELHPREGTSLKENITLQFDAYDKSGRLVAHSISFFRRDEVFGFETFSEDVYSPTAQISKIRILPKINKRQSAG